jgi:hypothetical protein
VVQAWHVLEPDASFVHGIHVQAICDHLQAVTEGRIRNLIINVPPGHAKSLLTAVFWPAWVWIDHAESRWLFSSYREPLATRDSVRCRRLIESDWYRERWGDRYQLTEDQNQKQRFENNRTGYRVVVPMSSGTGERGDYVVVDDPHSVDQAESDAERRAAVEWWNGSMSTRLNDFSTGHKVVIQQRLHESDLTGDLLVKGGYELLCLPAEFEGTAMFDLDRLEGSADGSGAVAVAREGHSGRSKGPAGYPRQLPLCGAVSAEAGACRRGNAQATLVAILAATGRKPAAGASEDAGWDH